MTATLRIVRRLLLLLLVVRRTGLHWMILWLHVHFFFFSHGWINCLGVHEMARGSGPGSGIFIYLECGFGGETQEWKSG